MVWLNCIYKFVKNNFIVQNKSLVIYLAHKQLADSDPVIILYKVVNRPFIALYGIITGSCLKYNFTWQEKTSHSSSPRQPNVFSVAKNIFVIKHDHNSRGGIHFQERSVGIKVIIDKLMIIIDQVNADAIWLGESCRSFNGKSGLQFLGSKYVVPWGKG